jgi:aerobic-type carbon monoxide dehydrogenase small subunit (CoxS/CutS family)
VSGSSIDVNGGRVRVTEPIDTPLLYVLRDRLGCTGPGSVAVSRSAVRAR